MLEDRFGWSVSVSGNTVVVGALYDDAGASDSGTAYVFNATTGALIATLANPTPAANDFFGYSVSVSGNTVVVGLPADDNTTTDTGGAYAFNATTGAYLASLARPTSATSDQFGSSVAADGNLRVVGAPLTDVAGFADAGIAYVFDATTGALVTTLTNPTPATNDQFGFSVAVFREHRRRRSVLRRHHGWEQWQRLCFQCDDRALVATLANPTPAPGDNFGWSVSISANNVVVGAYQDNAGAIKSGAAYVFNATTGTLVATLANPTPASNDAFGSSVSVSGNTVVVGALGDSTGFNQSGSVYVFNATNGALLTTLANPTPAAFDNFGQSVSISGNSVVVGAYLDDTAFGDGGQAYVFQRNDGYFDRDTG